MNRTMFGKDTFLSVFPGYGVTPDKFSSINQNHFVYEDFNDVEHRRTIDVNRSHFLKRDQFKMYTEELLKTSNMRGRK